MSTTTQATNDPPTNRADCSAAPVNRPETHSHVPDECRLPKCVTGWKRFDKSDVFEDGSQLLVAVPINDRHSTKRKWYYEYSVVVVKCDEDFFDLECNDESWGWSIFDVDFYVLLRR